MTEEEIDLFLDGTIGIEPDGKGGWEAAERKIPSVKKPPKFAVGQKVFYDYIRGSFGRTVGEGIIEEVNGLYLVLMKEGGFRYLRWFREGDLKDLAEVGEVGVY